MKITRKQLNQIIREELLRLDEVIPSLKGKGDWEHIAQGFEREDAYSGPSGKEWIHDPDEESQGIPPKLSSDKPHYRKMWLDLTPKEHKDRSIWYKEVGKKWPSWQKMRDEDWHHLKADAAPGASTYGQGSRLKWNKWWLANMRRDQSALGVLEHGARSEQGEGVGMTPAHNQPGYTHYALDKSTKKIESGWEFAEDAADRVREIKEESPGSNVGVYTLGYLKRSDIDPNDNSHWGDIA